MKQSQDLVIKFLLMLMGVLATRFVHARPSGQPPMDMNRNLSVQRGGGVIFLEIFSD